MRAILVFLALCIAVASTASVRPAKCLQPPVTGPCKLVYVPSFSSHLSELTSLWSTSMPSQASVALSSTVAVKEMRTNSPARKHVSSIVEENASDLFV